MYVDEAMRRYLSRQISGLGDPRQNEDEFAACLERVSGFLAKRGRLPDREATDPSEVRLGSWLQDQQSAEQRGVLCSERRSQLGELIGPGWAALG